jgi:HTH-type transcriptional regulator/antitoxin HigA
MPMYRRAEYARLLERAQPAVIHTEEQNETYLQTLGQLLARKEKQSVAEREMVALLTLLIENFEAEHYALPKAGPLAVLRFLMEQHDLKILLMNLARLASSLK